MWLPTFFLVVFSCLHPQSATSWRHCDQDGYTPVGYAAGAHDRAARSLEPIQRAAASILAELQTGGLLPEMVEPVASFALALVAVHDAFLGQCADHQTRDAISHKLCAVYVDHAHGMQAACAGRLTTKGALGCTCDDLKAGIVGICNADIVISAPDVPLCFRAQQAGCRSAIWGLCGGDGGTPGVVRPVKWSGAHQRHKTNPKHASHADHANAQQGGRWAHRAQQRMQAAAHPDGQPRATADAGHLAVERRVAIVGLPPPPVLSFLFLLSSGTTLNKLAAGRPGLVHTRQPVVCTIGIEAGARAKAVLAGANIDFRVAEGRPRASEMGLLIGGECDALALWWGHAEAIYTNPCDHGAALHPLCTKGTLAAFEVGHRLLKDPQGQSVATAAHNVQATLAAHAEHHKHTSRACQHALAASPHHHMPHC